MLAFRAALRGFFAKRPQGAAEDISLEYEGLNSVQSSAGPWNQVKTTLIPVVTAEYLK